LFASVNIISKEQVVRFGREAAIFEKSEEVVVLPVNITTDLVRSVSVDIGQGGTL